MSYKEHDFTSTNSAYLTRMNQGQKASEDSFAEVVQLIVGMKLNSFLTPSMAPKHILFDPFHVWHRFLTSCLTSKICQP